MRATAEKDALSWRTKWSYGVGHVLNDLCASMWFTYLLIFYEKVLEFSPSLAGLVLLVGQLADGLATPVVGILADMENKIPVCARYGRRKVWHLIGTILVLVSFPFIFSPCLGCEGADQHLQLVYYCAFVCVFQFGWASVQISHLALIPDLTSKKHQRTGLNSIRYAFTVMANLSVFAITYVILEIDSVENPSDMCNNPTNLTKATGEVVDECVETIGPEDIKNFQTVAFICMAIGGVFSIIFHIGTKEKPYVKSWKEIKDTEISPISSSSSPSYEATASGSTKAITTSEVTKPDLTKKELHTTTSVTTCGLPQTGMPQCQLNGTLSETNGTTPISTSEATKPDRAKKELHTTTSVTTCGLPQTGMPPCQLNGTLSQANDASTSISTSEATKPDRTKKGLHTTTSVTTCGLPQTGMPQCQLNGTLSDTNDTSMLISTSGAMKPELMKKELHTTTSVTTCGLPQTGMPQCQLNGTLSDTNDAMEEYTATPQQEPEACTDIPCTKPRRRMHLVDWFKEPQFYQVAVLYMATRLFVNLYQVYVPLYVQETLGLNEITVATVPFVMYLSGLLGSLVMKQINKQIGRKGTFILGCVIGLCGSLWVLIGATNKNMAWEVYIVAIFLGTGGSTLLITSLSITADLIGNNVEGGAFVYGAMSLVDKFSNGIIIMIIQNSDPDETWYYTSVIGFACGSSCILGILVTLTLLRTKIGKRRRASLAPSLFEDESDESDSGIDNPALCAEENLPELPREKDRF